MKFSSNANNSTLDSTFYLNTNNATSNVNVNISDGILLGSKNMKYRPTIMVKYTTTLHYVLVEKSKTQE